MFLSPDEPVVHHRASQQDTDTTCDWTQDCKPPRPTVDTLHCGVKAHSPSPEQCSSF